VDEAEEVVTRPAGMADRTAPPSTGVVHSIVLGTAGDTYDNTVAEAFWAWMQAELLDRQRWRTRLERANAIFEYIEGFHNRRRRHSALGRMSPIEFETTTPDPAPASAREELASAGFTGITCLLSQALIPA
jgi:hypothetical protein